MAAPASAVQSVPGRFWTWTAADLTGQIQPVLHAFGGTEQALSALAVADGPATRPVNALPEAGARSYSGRAAARPCPLHQEGGASNVQ
jgi:hypothetical protein